ncbi:MAG: Nicotinate-nucleotide adenylyltransferase [Clostridiales bacterium 38_11]|nr:MAG: Nicotinate-nucleotide adenylyltransferase [Clostridiales bacterium 38_11]
MKKYGIMGGTFDPIHFGHLVIANEVLNLFDLDRIIFVPTGTPPHKTSKGLTTSYHRYMMTQFATMTHPFFDVSDFEIRNDEISYTIDTLQHFRDSYPNSKFYFITGTDAVLELSTWKDPEGMLKIFTFIAVNRPGYVIENLDDKLRELADRYNGEIYAVNAPQLQISSTDIRNRISNGRPIKYLLPETVELYILKNRLYQKSER